MAKCLRYNVNESPITEPVRLADGGKLVFHFSTELRRGSFRRRLKNYANDVAGVLDRRYRGITVDAGLIAAVDLYSRIEIGEKAIDYIDVDDHMHRLGPGDYIETFARVKG